MHETQEHTEEDGENGGESCPAWTRTKKSLIQSQVVYH